MVFGSGPWAWRALPSVFDKDPCDVESRTKILTKRRVQAVFNALTSLKKDSIEEESNPVRKNQIDLIGKTLRCRNLEDAIETLRPWLLTEKKPLKSVSLKLKGVPGSITKDICAAIGQEGVPNIPLIQRMNVGAVSQYLDKVRKRYGHVMIYDILFDTYPSFVGPDKEERSIFGDYWSQQVDKTRGELILNITI